MLPVSNELSGDKQPLRGKDIERRARRSSAGVRAVLAARLANGAVAIVQPTRTQIAALTRLHLSTVSLAAHLSPDDLEQVKRGKMSLRQARAKRRRPLTDQNIVDFINRVGGAGVVMAVFDRMTASAPASVAAE